MNPIVFAIVVLVVLGLIGGFILAQITGVAGYRVLFSFCAVLMLAAMVYFYFMNKKEHY